MNIREIKDQLRREVTANPAKAAVLGVLFIVALYFWAPLVVGFFPSDSPGDATASGANQPVAAKSAAGPPSEKTSAKSPSSTSEQTQTPSVAGAWQKIREWIRADPRMLSAAAVDQGRDPFVTPKSEQPKKKSDEESKQDAEKLLDLTPKILGMTLNSTIVGSRRRLAVINGRAYLLGEWIRVKPGGSIEPERGPAAGSAGQSDIRFHLVHVESRRVVLQRDEKKYELKLPDTSLADHAISRAAVTSFGDGRGHER